MGTGQEAFFSGVPTFIKDNVDVAGQSRRCMAPTRGKPYSAPTARHLRCWAPAVSLGKTQLSKPGFSAVPNTPRLDRSVIRGIPTAQRVPHRDRAQAPAAPIALPTTAAADPYSGRLRNGHHVARPAGAGVSQVAASSPRRPDPARYATPQPSTAKVERER